VLNLPNAPPRPDLPTPPPARPQVAQLSEVVQSEKFELMNATQENERLREQIVQSPEKFQRSLADLQVCACVGGWGWEGAGGQGRAGAGTRGGQAGVRASGCLPNHRCT
jgi:hypothetical protein